MDEGKTKGDRCKLTPCPKIPRSPGIHRPDRPGRRGSCALSGLRRSSENKSSPVLSRKQAARFLGLSRPRWIALPRACLNCDRFTRRPVVQSAQRPICKPISTACDVIGAISRRPAPPRTGPPQAKVNFYGCFTKQTACERPRFSRRSLNFAGAAGRSFPPSARNRPIIGSNSRRCRQTSQRSAACSHEKELPAWP